MKVPRLFIISGPSGAGKGTLVSRARELRPDLALSISATTRAPRPIEKEGVHYYFLTERQFDELVEHSGFIEWAYVHGNRYGTLVSEVDRHLDEGNSLILEIDPQGAFQVKDRREDAVLIYIEPPSAEELEKRLRDRGTETEEAIQTRLSNMPAEKQASRYYDAIVINHEVESATKELLNIISEYEEGCR